MLARVRRSQQQYDRVCFSALERVDGAYTTTAPLIGLYAERSQQIGFPIETPTHFLLYDLEWRDDKHVWIGHARRSQFPECLRWRDIHDEKRPPGTSGRKAPIPLRPLGGPATPSR